MGLRARTDLKEPGSAPWPDIPVSPEICQRPSRLRGGVFPLAFSMPRCFIAVNDNSAGNVFHGMYPTRVLQFGDISTILIGL